MREEGRAVAELTSVFSISIQHSLSTVRAASSDDVAFTFLQSIACYVTVKRERGGGGEVKPWCV